MSDTPFQVALFAAGERDRRIDVLGVLVMLRDVILNHPISFLQVGTLYAVAAGAGASAFILLAELGAATPIAGVVCVAVATSVRLAAVRLDWRFPERRAAREWRS